MKSIIPAIVVLALIGASAPSFTHIASIQNQATVVPAGVDSVPACLASDPDACGESSDTSVRTITVGDGLH